MVKHIIILLFICTCASAQVKKDLYIISYQDSIGNIIMYSDSDIIYYVGGMFNSSYFLYSMVYKKDLQRKMVILWRTRDITEAMIFFTKLRESLIQNHEEKTYIIENIFTNFWEKYK